MENANAKVIKMYEVKEVRKSTEHKMMEMELYQLQEFHDNEIILRHMLRMPQKKLTWTVILDSADGSKNFFAKRNLLNYIRQHENFGELWNTTYGKVEKIFPNKYNNMFFIPVTNVLVERYGEQVIDVIELMKDVRDSLNSCIEGFTYPIEEIVKQTVLCWESRR